VACSATIGFHAEKVSEALQSTDVENCRMLKSTQSTRRVTRLLEKVLLSVDDPFSSEQTGDRVPIDHPDDLELEPYRPEISGILNKLKNVRKLEDCSMLTLLKIAKRCSKALSS